VRSATRQARLRTLGGDLLGNDRPSARGTVGRSLDIADGAQSRQQDRHDAVTTARDHDGAVAGAKARRGDAVQQRGRSPTGTFGTAKTDEESSTQVDAIDAEK